ncbi:MAG TPA: alpha/beta fold hydrolase [Candidatus Acidoferrales bacterium]|jgi:pimeloyl-ACP methyl ester carboxylesterase|nr:alpha/beta fold hydrolase [Candidatus Acidoferrales bacterium]
MIAPLAKFIDWSALQAMTWRTPRDNGQSPRLEEALQFLKGPDFIPATSQPAQLEFNDSLHFRFPTPRPCGFAENNVVYGRLYRADGNWQERPAIILLHGWNSAPSHHVRFPLLARRCHAAGFNTVTLELPYHFQRRPRQPGALGGVDSYYLQLAERTAQAVAEIRALIGWLEAQGCPAVALWGSSYGGWLAGLTACHDSRLAAVVMAVPGVYSNRSRANRIIWRRSREMSQKQDAALARLDMTALNLTLSRPVIPAANILLIEATHDLFTMKEPIEELWQAWGQPDIWRLPHGHFSFGLIGAPCLMATRTLGWLTPRLAAKSPKK